MLNEEICAIQCLSSLPYDAGTSFAARDGATPIDLGRLAKLLAFEGSAGESVMTEIGRWIPVRDTHAIQMAAIGVTFSEFLPELTWAQVRKSASAKAKGLGLETETPQTVFQVMIGPGGPMPATQPTGAPASVDYMKMERPDFFSDKFTVSRQALRYEEWSYTRWAVLLDKAEAVMSEIFQSYGSAARIATVYVDYIDVFQAKSEVGARADCGEVIERSSPLVAAAAFDPVAPWHTYTGHFEAKAPDVRRLHQVNIDVGDGAAADGDVQVIQVRTLITDQMNLPFLQAFDPSHQTWPIMRERFQNLHDEANATVGRVLTGGAAAAISLK